MEFWFAKDFKETKAIHDAWWLTLTPAQRWKSNWAQVDFLL